MKTIDIALPVLFLLPGLVLGAPAASPAPPPASPAPPAAARPGAPDTAPRLEPTTGPAAGKRTSGLTVSRFGRYAVTAESREGVALQLVDRMAGPGAVNGAAGERDGRLDVFLEAGDYRVVTHGHERAHGTVKLAAHAFTERHLPEPPLLPELRLVEETLADFEQASWWIEVKQGHTHHFEAAGRSLADLRLWKDGTWLVDAAPTPVVVQPRPGQPVRLCRISVNLQPGLYLLTAYGGPAQPWSEGDAHPLYVRAGIPRLPEAGRQRFLGGPFGSDRYRVPGTATFFRLELPQARAATLEVASVATDAQGTERTEDAESASESSDASEGSEPDTAAAATHAASGEATQGATITKTSVPPVAELTASSTEGEHTVTVTGDAGQPYVLQQFVARDLYPIPGGGGGVTVTSARPVWVSTIHSGDARDAMDATALVVRTDLEVKHVEPLAAQAVELDAASTWSLRANLLGPTQVLLHATALGTWEVRIEGLAAQARVEPFLVSRPKEYKSPPLKPSGSTFTLDPGYHLLTVEPQARGVATLTVRPPAAGVASAASVAAAPTAKPTVGPAAHFPELALDRNGRYTVYVGRQPEVRIGLVVRALPLDLREALPLALGPRAVVSARFTAPEAGTLRATTDDGQAIRLAVDGGGFAESQSVAAGEHKVTVQHGDGPPVQASLQLVPTALDPKTPLPALPDTARAELPDLPVLAAGQPQFLDLADDERAMFLVRAQKPGLYQLESTGLLATVGDVRTRTVTSFAHAATDGVGRNFQVRTYLRAGDYMLSVETEGKSAGHLGVVLAPTTLQDGGFITNRRPARATLAAGEGIAYRFVITKPGEFRVRALGLGRELRARLEDADGWPVRTPGDKADFSGWLDPGRYRLIVLPQATEARVVTVIEPLASAPTLTGHGPHPLPLAERRKHLWLEPEAEGAPRPPDVWTFTLPAEAPVQVELTDAMEGELVRNAAAGAPGEAPITLPPGRGWKGTLAAGTWQIRALCARRDNRAPYTVGVWPEPLLPGLERDVAAPAEVAIAIGQPGLVEISSFGATDVRARLLDASGRTLAQSDDRPDDWNFALAATVAPGRYRLRVDPVGASTATTRVAVRMPLEVEKPALLVPAATDLIPGRDVHVHPLQLPATGTLLAVTARSAESIGLALEAKDGDGAWRGLGSTSGRAPRLAVPRIPGRAYRLRLWSLDRRGSPVRVSVALGTPGTVAERAGTATLTSMAGTDMLFAAVATVDRPGLFSVEGTRWICGDGDHTCAEDAGPVVAAAGPLYLIAGAAGTARVTRVVVGSGREAAVAVRAGERAQADLVASPGPVLLEATSPAGQPAIAPGTAADATQSAVAPRQALAVALSTRTAVAWSASEEDPASEVRLRATAFPAPTLETRGLGLSDGTVSAGRATSIALPAGPKRLRLTLARGLVAALATGDAVTSVHAAVDAARTETLETTADRLLLLARAGSGDAAWALQVSAAGPALSVSADAPLEIVPGSAGLTRITVAAGTGAVHVRGGRDAVLLRPDGRVQQGRDFALGDGAATLVVTHGPSLVLAWRGEVTLPPWKTTAPAETITLPLARTLSGESTTLALATAEPRLVHVRTSGPVVSQVVRERGPGAVEVHPQGARLDVPLDGHATLTLRGLAGSPLGGRLEIDTSPILRTAEGLGPSVLLAPGSARAFSFRVEHEGPVGVGLRASAEVVDLTLLTPEGSVLGEGPVQMRTLAPGTYVLLARAPADVAPITVRPAVAGLDPPPTTPPPDVVAKYRAAEVTTTPGAPGEMAEGDDVPAAEADGAAPARPTPVAEPEDEGGVQ